MNSELGALRDLQEAERAEMAQQAAEQLTNSIGELQSLGQDPVPIIAEQIPELNPYAQQGQGQEAPQGQEQGLPQIPQQQPSQEEMAMMQQQQMQQQQPMAGYGGPRKDHIGGYGYGGDRHWSLGLDEYTRPGDYVPTQEQLDAQEHMKSLPEWEKKILQNSMTGGIAGGKGGREGMREWYEKLYGYGYRAMGGNVPKKDHIGGYAYGGRIPAKDEIGGYGMGGRIPAKDHIGSYALGGPFDGIKDKFSKWRYGEAPTQETGESDEDFQARLKKYNEETAAKKAGDKRKVGAAVQSIPDVYGLVKSIQKPDEFNPYLRPDAETTDISSLVAPIDDAEANARGEMRNYMRGSGFRNPGAFIAGNSQAQRNSGLSEARLKFQADNADRARQNEIDLFNISERQRAKMLIKEQDDNRISNIGIHGKNIANNITGVGLDKEKTLQQANTIEMLNSMYPNANVTIGPDGKILFNGNPLDA
jgi:hypothetical protein